MDGLKPLDVEPVVRRLAGIANHTPVLTSRTLDDHVEGHVFLKCENFQRIGAFKFRGAYNAISQLSRSQRDVGVVTHSSGNHAQGVALAAKLLGVEAVVVMPFDAPPIKRAATEGYGASIVTCEAIDRENVANDLVKRHGYTLIHPYDNRDIILGQGTAAWELIDEVDELDYLFVPVGGGGLISGCALAAAALAPECRVIGVEPEAADDARQSWLSGRVVELDRVPDTVADGLRPRHIGQLNLDIMRSHVADMTTVSEQAIISTLLFLWQRMKIVVEPSAAVALAPIFTGRYKVKRNRIGVILSGGNVDLLNLPASIRAQTAAVNYDFDHDS